MYRIGNDKKKSRAKKKNYLKERGMKTEQKERKGEKE